MSKAPIQYAFCAQNMIRKSHINLGIVERDMLLSLRENIVLTIGKTGMGKIKVSTRPSYSTWTYPPTSIKPLSHTSSRLRSSPNSLEAIRV